jgi:pimeloyl-ACP methyl ester carboxylesterase/predicted glycosyltransferase
MAPGRMVAMRAVRPEVESFVERGGVKVGYEVYGDGPVTVLFGPYWPIVPSQAWKMQVAYLSRHFRVIAVDARGQGRSDRPDDPEAYRDVEFAGDIVAVLDAAGVDRAVLVGHCSGAWWCTLAAARHPERVSGLVAFAPNAPHLVPPPAHQAEYDFDAVLDTDEGWAKVNRHYWARDFPGYLEFYFGELVSDPHSSKLHEDCVGWGMGADPRALEYTSTQPRAVADRDACAALLAGIGAPALVIHSEDDRCTPYRRGQAYAELTRAQLVTLPGAGHLPQARYPVAVNRWIRDFVNRVHPPPAPPRRWTRSVDRPRRVLYLSSPIGLGHARRDMSIVEELRKLRPDVQVDWLAQQPVAGVLAARGERIHPASAHLSSEVAHWESEADEHDLHAFQAVRRMDEILLANFGVFADLVETEHYDLWVGDEAWEVDHFLHENPELKRAPYVWLTDFVGWLPMPDGGAAEAALTADYNSEMIEQIERFPRLRDRALFVGDPEDVVPDGFGAGLPGIREWTRRHYAFTGYITGIDPAEIADRDALRAALGWPPGQPVCVVAVGGTGVGEHLLRRVVAAFPRAAALVPGLRMEVVAGPRIDPRSLPAAPGLRVHGYLPDLYRYLAACDLAVVQGGLTTTMELTAAGTPFLYVPLRHHFEQSRHVPHRLARYRAGHRLDYPDTAVEPLAQAIAGHIGRPVSYRPVAGDGAARAAAYLAEIF